MSKIEIFQFNAFQVNTLILWDETKECVIIDPGCISQEECNRLTKFIQDNDLKPVHLLNTHYHIDHIAGNKFIHDKYHLPIEAHQAGHLFWENSTFWSGILGVSADSLCAPDKYFKEDDIIEFGKSTLKVLYTPGHADGSVCLYNECDNYIIVGDVLFYGSIGRTDLPSGNYIILKQSIENKLFILPDSTIVFPGHGTKTTIGFEKNNNPFL